MPAATLPFRVRAFPVDSPAMNDFKPGLEGIVAVETEIAEPDREGGQLRYRGGDIEELVGHYPYENVWGLLVDDDLDSRMPEPEPYEPARLTGRAPADLQAGTAASPRRTTSSPRGRRPRRSSCCAGAARPTPGTSRRSTRTGSAPPSTA